MLDTGLKGRQNGPIRRPEQRHIEVVVVVDDGQRPTAFIQQHPNRVVCDAGAAQHPQTLPGKVEHLHAVTAIVADVNLLAPRDGHRVGELNRAGAVKGVQQVASKAKDKHPHHLALHHHHSVVVIHGQAARVAQVLRAEFHQKGAGSVVDLNLVHRGAFTDDHLAADRGEGDSVGKLEPTLAKVVLELAPLVEDLNAVVVRVRYVDVLRGEADGDARGLGKLAIGRSLFAKLQNVGHAISPQFRLKGLLVLDGVFRCSSVAAAVVAAFAAVSITTAGAAVVTVVWLSRVVVWINWWWWRLIVVAQ